ncbi:DUF4280 domain-containing protein [uncultured Bacteroides sp.]|uniref:DUF4280 domain-containing protein n=1 Tax=uncultured Bacteroides sp. TaxID=162156 RepID=UPI00262EED8E|nr:DUF4280 domain-containing protein [uncultured Bacteroides sp.]
MAKYVCMGATLKCTFGQTPSTLSVIVPLRPMIQNKPKATIMDYVPMVNVMPFGMCTSLSNPTVASATSAAMGVLTPMPCVPVIVAPWAPGGKQMITNMPALLDNCKLMCAYGGNISINMPGHTCNSEGK